MNTYLTQAEVDALQTSGLHTKTPYLIQGVSSTIFSIARYSGGATYNGDHYLYLPLTDELIREDVNKWLQKRRKPPKKVKPKAAELW